MILIIVARDYRQFKRYVNTHFPYLSRGLGIEKHFTHITSEDGINKILSLERNQPVLYIGGEYSLVLKLKQERFCVEILLQ